MTISEARRFEELKKKVFGSDLFVAVDSSNPEWVEYNELVKKWQGLFVN